MDIPSGASSLSDSKGKKSKDRRKGKSRRRLDQRISDYIAFGHTTSCLLIFVLFYALVLTTLWPLLSAEIPEAVTDETPRDYIEHMHIPPSLKKVAHVPGQEKISEMAGAFKDNLQKLRQGRGVTDAALLDQARQEFQDMKKEKDEQPAVRQVVQAGDAMDVGGHRQGFVVLGMHRSGTSMLAGLLHTSSGYTVGGPLIGAADDNAKGFFERIDIVLQNDDFMKAQKVWWAANVISYDWEKALKDKEDGTVDFDHGETGLEFLNNPKNAPWLQKDPRMCITLKTWLKLMDNEPAVVFTYRHPLEVAMSLSHRESTFTLERGLRLWIVYNMRAIQNSKGLCIVRSSNEAILADPKNEIQRISDELTSKCNVLQAPSQLSQADVDKFIDPSLQHNKNKLAEAQKEKKVITTYNDGNCKVYEYESAAAEGSTERERETQLYGRAMKIYCDFQSGLAYQDDYEWPELH